MIYTKKLTILKSIPISFDISSNGIMESRIFVSEGDDVEPSKLLARIYRSEKEATFDLLQELNIKSVDLPKHLEAMDGQVVLAGKILAHKSFFASEVMVKAPFDGVVTIENKAKTTLLKVKSIPVEIELYAGVKGIVSSVSKEEVVIDSAGIRIFSRCMFGNSVRGILHIVEDLNEISEEYKGMVIFYPGMITADQILKAESVGIKGIIGISLSFEVFLQPFSIPIVGLEGFGSISVPFYDKLKQSEGFLVLIDPQSEELLVTTSRLIEDRKSIYLKEPVMNDSVQVFDVKYFALTGKIQSISGEEATVSLSGAKELKINVNNLVGILI